MRIVHILNHTRHLNGHVHAMVDLACAEAAMGHEICVASGGGDFDELLRERGIRTATVDHERSVSTLLRSAVALRRLLREFRPAIVHAHMMTSAVLAFPICQLLGIPLITTVHNEFEKSATLMGLGTRVIAVSEAVNASMQRRGISSSRIDTVLNGTIGSARLEGRIEVPARLQSPSILFVGGLHPRKGLPDLLHAFDRISQRWADARLYVVGDGPLREEYKTMAASLSSASCITFIGPSMDPYQYMLAADVFVLPSHADPAPLVLSEAREAGCAIIGTNVDGIPQLLEEGAAGILVPPNNPASLAAALDELLAFPENMRHWKAKSQYRIENLRIDRVAHETLDVYRSAMAMKQRTRAAV
ncbi:glycosyl transferase [Rhizobium sp. Root708]|uniref:glycosyltransferase family 4 protein n=1 Tax=Rhizobium sp. Root708 TaxID=1736592 RepID=UPI0006F1F66E|nr:glycosyltransferase family 4 protein [Rhizobium sp. Root708]KRB49290.1 glycosyl transferase [Rhizobium sp. Root708]